MIFTNDIVSGKEGEMRIRQNSKWIEGKSLLWRRGQTFLLLCVLAICVSIPVKPGIADSKDKYGGIGAYTEIRSGKLTVASPIKGTPAYRAGIRAEDRIIKIDGVSTEGVSLEEASEKLRGKPGTQVKLTIERAGANEPIEYGLIREIIRMPLSEKEWIVSEAKRINAKFDWPYDVQFPGESWQCDMDITTYEDLDKDLSLYKTFDFDYTNKINPLLEKELCKMVEKKLVGNGLTRSRNNPDILITMSFYTGKKEKYTPPKTITTTRVEQVWSSGMLGLTPIGAYHDVPITESQTIPGKTEVSYYRNIHLNFLDYSKLRSGVKLDIPPLIWIGEVGSEGSSSDIRIVAPDMTSELLDEFPQKSGKPMSRHVVYTTSSYGSIGIKVDPEHCRTILEVLPGSPAESAGIHEGDIIKAIDGKRVTNGSYESYIAVGAFGLPKSVTKDPYLEKVLDYHGSGKEVKFLIKSPGSKGKREVVVSPKVIKETTRNCF